MKPLKLFHLFFVLGILIFSSCKKDTPVTPETNTNNQQNKNVPSPGLCTAPSALAVFNGNLVAAYSDSISQWNGSKWVSFGSGFSVSALLVFNSNLYAAAGNSVKMWNGSSWQVIGTFNSYVSALTVYNGNLIAGGHFTSNGGNPDTCIAEWNGSSWLALGSGLYGTVSALTVYNGNLIAAGSISRAGNTHINNIAQWNGSTWDSLGSGIHNSSTIFSLAVNNGNLFVGGIFYEIFGPGDTASAIAQWNGSVWSNVGISQFNVGYVYPPVPPSVDCFTIYNNNLVVGGFFGVGNVGDLGIWNGSSWSTAPGLDYKNPPYIGNGNYAPMIISTCIVYNGNLVVGGSFDTAGSLKVRNIAMWNGSSWSAL